MPSGGTGLSKVGAFVVLQGAVGFEAFELGITETSGETGVGLYDGALKSSSEYRRCHSCLVQFCSVP